MSGLLFPALRAEGSGAAAPSRLGSPAAQSEPGSRFSLLATHGLEPAGASLIRLAAETARAQGISPAVFVALVETESGFNPQAVSPAGAMGLSQLMPATARTLGVSHPLNPEQSLTGGAKYLAQLMAEFHSLPLALAAYNAGPAAVRFYGGVPPYPQTRAYVADVLARAASFQA